MSRSGRRKAPRRTASAKPPVPPAAPAPAQLDARAFDLFYACRHRARGNEMPCGEQRGWTIAAWIFARLEELQAAYAREAALAAMTGASG